jgi:mediator of replication checkpoint protein 1
MDMENEGSPSSSRQRLKGPMPLSNAFNVLIANAQKDGNRKRRRLERSEFVEGEAVESDDDEMFGFGPHQKKDDEESDDEDPNAVVEGLVDDEKMDADTLAEDKVLEKHMYAWIAREY